ncbi:MAG: putative porin, partial [Bacteroidia bacterium]|nr:putative porin [Bacteroidia bacterium]
RFALMNTVLFQQVLSGEDVLNVPQIVTRQTLYYEDEWFEKAMAVQTGIGFKYFTSYNMNAYDPVLGEFYVQNSEKLGAFPLVDIFFNAKIRQTRIFVKYEHINQLFNSSNNHFSAPGYPYRDAVIRFGLVWNFFL